MTSCPSSGSTARCWESSRTRPSSSRRRRSRAGDVLVLHTDGVTEARRGDIFFGEDRLRDMVMKGDGTAQEIADGLVDHVLDFQEGDPRDDMAVVVLRVP